MRSRPSTPLGNCRIGNGPIGRGTPVGNVAAQIAALFTNRDGRSPQVFAVPNRVPAGALPIIDVAKGHAARIAAVADGGTIGRELATGRLGSAGSSSGYLRHRRKRSALDVYGACHRFEAAEGAAGVLGRRIAILMARRRLLRTRGPAEDAGTAGRGAGTTGSGRGARRNEPSQKERSGNESESEVSAETHPQLPTHLPSVAKQVLSTQYPPGHSESCAHAFGPHAPSVHVRYEGHWSHESAWHVPSDWHASQ
jgi:hypothetical protein